MQLDSVSIRDNFFDLGGTSLKLEQIHTRMQDELGFGEPITTLFQYPTIETLAEHIGESSAQPSTGGAADPGKRRASHSAVNIRAQARKRRGAFGMQNSPDEDK
jgi:acyl carrier protein